MARLFGVYRLTVDDRFGSRVIDGAIGAVDGSDPESVLGLGSRLLFEGVSHFRLLFFFVLGLQCGFEFLDLLLDRFLLLFERSLEDGFGFGFSFLEHLDSSASPGGDIVEVQGAPLDQLQVAVLQSGSDEVSSNRRSRIEEFSSP